MKIVKFSSTWCSPCKTIAPIVKEVSEEFNIDVEEIDVEENNDLCMKYNIRSIPVLVFEVDNKEVGRLTGMQTKDKIIDLVKKIHIR